MHAFEQRLAAAWPPAQWQDVGVVVAVSGGADSVGLLRGLAAIKHNGCGALYAAHFNHRLRGAESESDAQFVADLSRVLGFSYAGGAAPPAAEPVSRTSEEASRRARYDFLERTAEELGARYVATAHTADDQAETILHRIVRGTSIDGLRGIRRVRPLGTAVTLIRPLLSLRRSEVRQYLEDLGQPFHSDASNLDLGYTRNRIRHTLLRELEDEYNPEVVDALNRLGRLAGEAQEVIEDQLSELVSSAVAVVAGGTMEVDCAQLNGTPRYLVRQLFVELWRMHNWPLRAMGFEEWDGLADMAVGSTSAAVAAKKNLPGNITAQRRGAHLTLSPPRAGLRSGT